MAPYPSHIRPLPLHLPFLGRNYSQRWPPRLSSGGALLDWDPTRIVFSRVSSRFVLFWVQFVDLVFLFDFLGKSLVFQKIWEAVFFWGWISELHSGFWWWVRFLASAGSLCLLARRIFSFLGKKLSLQEMWFSGVFLGWFVVFGSGKVYEKGIKWQSFKFMFFFVLDSPFFR